MFFVRRIQRKTLAFALVLFPNSIILRSWFRRIQIKISNESIQIKRGIDKYFQSNLSEDDWKVFRRLKHKSKSQCRQDLIIGLINQWNPGAIIEVGATDGLLLSNSLMLEQYLDWEAVLVEPGRYWRDKLKFNRPSATLVFDAAFHSPNVSLSFTETEYAELSGFTTLLPKDFWSGERENAVNYSVNTTTLDQICDNHSMNGKFLAVTVDIEGGELEALRGFTKNLSQANLLIIENNENVETIFSLDEILLNQNFTRLVWPFESFDSWYLRDDSLVNCLVLARLLHSGMLTTKSSHSH